MDPREFITEKLNHLRGMGGPGQPPFHPEHMMTSCGVVKVVRRPLNSNGGYAVKGATGFVIVINSSDPPVRQRFTMAHEIAHVLLADANMDSNEELCNWAAAEILMPERIFRSYAEPRKPSPESVIALSNTFQVSLNAVITRLIDLDIWRVVFVWWQPYDLDGHRRALRVQRFRRPSWCRVYIPVGDSVSASSAIGEAFVSGEPVEAIERLDLGSLRGSFRVRARRLPDGRVLSAIELDTPLHSERPKRYFREPYQLSLWRGIRIAPEDLFDKRSPV